MGLNSRSKPGDAGGRSNAAVRTLAAERRELVMWLRRMGYSYPNSARAVVAACHGNPPAGYPGTALTPQHLPKNYDGPRCWKDAKEVLTGIHKRTEESVNEVRSELGEQLDEILELTLREARSGNVYGAQVGIMAAQAKAKLLGLNKPELKQISGPEGGPVPISIIREAQAAASKEDED